MDAQNRTKGAEVSGGCPWVEVLIGSFAVAAVVVMVAGLLLLGLAVWRLATGRFPGVAELAGGAIESLTLIILGAILLGLHRLIRLGDRIDRSNENLSVLLSQAIKPGGPGEPVIQDIERLGIQLEQANRLLQEINEHSLLDEEGRRRKYEYLAQQQRRQVFSDVEGLVRDHEWAQAKALLENLGNKFPGNAGVSEFLVRVEDQRKQAFNEELVQVRKNIADLIAISAWDRAIRMAEGFLEKHPDMAAARELVIHVRSERNKFREDQIKRMAGDIQRSIGKKRWSDALQVARQLTEKYPDSAEAEALRGQMATLQANAEIEKRQELEEQIKDLVRRRSFIQARELARYVIDNYPTSPQAAALRQQIDKLDELSRQQEKEIPL